MGDMLLLLADKGFRQRWRDRTVFLRVSQMGGLPPGIGRRAWLVATIGLWGSWAVLALGLL